MSSAVDILEDRVAAAVGMIDRLRDKVRSLERELETVHSAALPPPAPPPQASCDPALLEELERLRAERVAVREGIRGLLREIDQVTW